MQITKRRIRIYRQDMPEACPYSKCVAADAFPFVSIHVIRRKKMKRITFLLLPGSAMLPCPYVSDDGF
jgi:hypothetical protein